MLTSLVGLLTHENMDIVIDVVELIYELTDEDADMEYEDENYEIAEEPLKVLVEGLVSYSDWLETSIKQVVGQKFCP
jgi:beta-catenin-like protein 1